MRKEQDFSSDSKVKKTLPVGGVIVVILGLLGYANYGWTGTLVCLPFLVLLIVLAINIRKDKPKPEVLVTINFINKP